MKVSHIAVYTENMEASVRFYQLLGGREGMRSTLDLGGGKSKDLLHMVFDRLARSPDFSGLLVQLVKKVL